MADNRIRHEIMIERNERHVAPAATTAPATAHPNNNKASRRCHPRAHPRFRAGLPRLTVTLGGSALPLASGSPPRRLCSSPSGRGSECRAVARSQLALVHWPRQSRSGNICSAVGWGRRVSIRVWREGELEDLARYPALQAHLVGAGVAGEVTSSPVTRPPGGSVVLRSAEPSQLACSAW